MDMEVSLALLEAQVAIVVALVNQWATADQDEGPLEVEEPEEVNSGDEAEQAHKWLLEDIIWAHEEGGERWLGEAFDDPLADHPGIGEQRLPGDPPVQPAPFDIPAGGGTGFPPQVQQEGQGAALALEGVVYDVNLTVHVPLGCVVNVTASRGPGCARAGH